MRTVFTSNHYSLSFIYLHLSCIHRMIHPFVPRLVNIHLSSKRNGINYVFCTLINHTSHHSVQWTTFTVILDKGLHDLCTEPFKTIAESPDHGAVVTTR